MLAMNYRRDNGYGSIRPAKQSYLPKIKKYPKKNFPIIACCHTFQICYKNSRNEKPKCLHRHLQKLAAPECRQFLINEKIYD